MRLPALAALLALAAALPAAPALAAPVAAQPVEGGELLIMNDGLKPVTGVRLRPAGEDGSWTADVLGGEPILVNEGRRIDLTGRGLGCNIEVRFVLKDAQAGVPGEIDVCSGDPRFWIAFALGLDESGMGARPGMYAMVVGEDPPPPPKPTNPGRAAPRVDLNRGLPVCPGDPRCRKKK